MNKFYIDQHGCAKNQTDGELLVSYLEKEGFSHTFNADEADFILINSCGFIESAKKESIDAIYSVKSAYPEAKIILTGCLAQRYAQMLLDSMPELDGVFGNGDLSKIAELMKSVKTEKRTILTSPQEGVCGGERKKLFNFKGSAFVKITEGCSNHCSFCAIPLIRGEVRSRDIEEVINEIKDLIAGGVYEINLIGQDLAVYQPSLAVLLERISALEGDFVVRLLYIHPDHFKKDIIPVMQKDKRFLHYFDIPFQSGDDKIIRAMNRTGSQQQYINLVSYIRSELPDCMIRTTFLTGFPGETEECAENTCNFLKAITPDWSGCFPYSREEDTPAYDMKPRVPKKTAEKRAAVLEEIQTSITEERLKRFVGKTVNVLIEEIIEVDENVAEDTSEGLAIGRGWFQAPEVDGCIVIRYDRDSSDEKSAVKVGNVVSVNILATTGVDLDGRFVKMIKKFPEDTDLTFISE